MQTLVFNTTKKFVILYEGARDEGKVIERMENIPTVVVKETYYEVIQKKDPVYTLPVMRLPVSNTNMIIIKED